MTNFHQLILNIVPTAVGMSPLLPKAVSSVLVTLKNNHIKYHQITYKNH